MWMPPPEQRNRFILMGAGGLAAILLVWLLVPSSDDGGDPDVVVIDKLVEKEDVEGIAQVVASAKPKALAPAYRGLQQMGPRARQHVRAGLTRDKHHQVLALKSLPYVAPEESDRKEVQQIVQKTTEPEVKRAALDALAGMKAWDSLPTVLQMMDDLDAGVRRSAAATFEKIAYIKIGAHYRAEDTPAQRRKAISALQQFVNDPTRRVRYQEWITEMEAKKAAGGKK